MPYIEQAASPQERRAGATDALERLLEGNRRFAAGGLLDNKFTAERRLEVADRLAPSAVIIGCVDARVPPEMVLGAGVGELITVRTAGQSLSGVALGSLEFGVQTLGIPLLVVLGHTDCGAVLSAIGGVSATGHLGEMIGEVAARLVDVVGDDPIGATGGNLTATVDALRKVGTMEKNGDPAFVVGLMYDVVTGLVTVVDDAGLLSGDESSSTPAAG